MKPKPLLLSLSFLVSAGVAAYLALTIPLSTQLYLTLTQWYGFIAIGFLFTTLLPGPLYRIFPGAPFNASYRPYLSPLGISTFYFALLHGAIAFWGLLEGFHGIPYLPAKYLIALLLGFFALLILAALAGTSFDYARIRMGKNWKRLHQLVYLAGFLAAAHVVMSGSHFAELGNPIAIFWTVLFLALTILHAINLNRRYRDAFRHADLVVPGAIALSLLLAISILNALHTYVHGSHH